MDSLPLPGSTRIPVALDEHTSVLVSTKNIHHIWKKLGYLTGTSTVQTDFSDSTTDSREDICCTRNHQRMTCPWCPKTFSGDMFFLDHYIRKHRGDQDSWKGKTHSQLPRKHRTHHVLSGDKTDISHPGNNRTAGKTYSSRYLKQSEAYELEDTHLFMSVFSVHEWNDLRCLMLLGHLCGHDELYFILHQLLMSNITDTLHNRLLLSGDVEQNPGPVHQKLIIKRGLGRSKKRQPPKKQARIEDDTHETITELPTKEVFMATDEVTLHSQGSMATDEVTFDSNSTTMGATVNKKRKKLLTIEQLQELGSINVLSVSTDLCEEHCVTGPWNYCNPRKCVVKFTVAGSPIGFSMRLDNLFERGLPLSVIVPSSLAFRWYSWIRFKSIAKVKDVPISSALSDEREFLFLLNCVSRYYTRNPYAQKEEGLEPNCGPQSFADSSNVQLLHYYGKGTIKYYRKTTFLQVVAQQYGENVKAEYLVHPATPLIDASDYEEILNEVNRDLSRNYTRHLNKLDKHAGPQCNEDRIHHGRVNYDVKFRSASAKARSTSNEDPATDDQYDEDQLKEDKLSEFYLRKCHVCNKIRWLGKRAAEKFVLGSYCYSEVDRQVHFSCNLLHDTSCDEEDDIMPLCAFDECPPLWVAYKDSNDSKLPPVAFVIKTLHPVSEAVSEAEVMAKYACTNHELSKCSYKAICTKSMTMARVELGQRQTTGRFRRYAEIPLLSKGKLNRNTPREALVCQSWLDHSQLSSEDPSAHFTVTNLSGIRDLHATYGAMKMIHCSQCGMCSPGFEADIDNCVTVPEGGKDVPLNNPLLTKALKQSKILSNSSVRLSKDFAAARVYKKEAVTGVCTECAKFCEIDNQGVVTLLHEHVSNSQEESSQQTNNSQQPLHDNISNINPYSVENLMALDTFQDEASHQYAMFMDTLSQAEKLVLSPIHAVIVILRSRTNNVPFSRHGSISFQMKEPVMTRSLPWHTFQQLPFVVMVSTREDGSVEEAKINMAKIVHAKELMEREVICPVYGTKRPFYRYCDKVHTPFTIAAMETLASQLSDTNTAVPPNGLKPINVDLIHERATKRMNFHLFSEWLNSGFTIGNGLKDAFIIENNQSSSVNHEVLTKQLWDVINQFVKSRLSQNARPNNDDNVDDSAESLQITPKDVIRCGVEKHWLNPNTEVSSASQPNRQEVLLPADELKNLTFMFCEEIELLLRESSNDEGNASSVAQGGVVTARTESPEEILMRGMQDTVLERIPAPQIDRQRPVPENTTGYLQMAFPDVFLTGDGCPHQERPRNIKNASENYMFYYFKWLSQQPRAMVNIELQFLIHSLIKRQHSKGKAKLALRGPGNAFDQGGIPVKEDLVKNAQLREWTASNLMMFKSSIPDSTPFWKRSRDDAIAVQRDWEEAVPWRPHKTPMSMMLFQTRAPPYNHHPAIHRLCPDAQRLSTLTDEEFLEGRRRNVLQYPSIISFMCGFMAELDTKFVSELRYGGDSYFTRFEWGANANPHAHRLLFSEEFSNFTNALKQRIGTCCQEVNTEAVNNGQDLGAPLVQESIHAKVLDCWDGARKEYIELIRPFYTNWNAGLLPDGETKTFDFIYERKTTICRLDIATVIDEALTTGQFSELDTIYVSVVNGTCRHLGHSGINDRPAKTDKCAIIKKKRVTSKTPGKKEYKDVVTCKRRKPHPINDKPTIEPDPHNKKIVQLQFESNDKWFNGHDPFEILHILSTADDKAVVPEFLRKPPVLKASSNTDEVGNVEWDLSLEYFSEVGDSATEYTTKYVFKDVVNTKTSAELLVTAMENLQDVEQINQGTVQKMYNSHAITGTTSIFQATHLNQKLPHVISNVNIKHCCVSGLSLLRNDYNPDDGEDYLIPPLIKLFDGRHDSTVLCKERGKLFPELKAEIQSDMCLHQFCDLYDVKEIKCNDQGTRTSLFTRRGSGRAGRMNALKLIPCHGLKVANPNNKLHWHYCRTLCLWKIPCHLTADFTPVGENDETIKKGWIDLFNTTFVDGTGLPPWAYKFWKHYNLPRCDSDSDISSDEEDEEENQHIAANDESMMDGNTNNSNTAGDGVCTSRPTTRLGHEQFYQNPVDRMRGGPQSEAQGLVNDDHDIESSCLCDTDVLANPEGVDFMDMWLKDRIIPTTAEIHAQLGNLINTEGTVSPDSFNSSTLNEKQRMAHDMVVQYVKSRIEWDDNGQQGPPPAPLRLILMGNPGTGKSWTLKCFMSTLVKLIGVETDEDGQDRPAWLDKIKLAAPTGAASSHMHFKAETLHRLFCIPIHLIDENLRLDETSAAYVRLMTNFDPKKFILLIIDEFSMLSRQMFAFITERMEQCNLDLNKIGIVFIGDPAQILPIGADPLWSARLHTDQGKDCNSISLLGMTRFREIFSLLPLQNIPGYDKWKGLKLPKDRIISEETTAFRKKIMQGDFDAVFLTEVKRADADPISQEFTGKILLNLRYGVKCREKEIHFLRKHCAKESEVGQSEAWRTAHVIHGYHFHSKGNAKRGSVEADNARALIRHHEATGNPIMRIDSMHRPVQKQARLMTLSAKEFEGAPPNWHACKGMRVMLLRNIAPSIGLYNGSIHTLVGPIYKNDSIEVSLTLEYLKSAVLNDCITTMPIDTSAKEKQIPPKSILLSVDGVVYDKTKFNELPPQVQMQCKFQFPRNPPRMPDFMVVEASNYSEPNILKLSGCQNYVPIAPVESHKPDKSKSKAHQTRIALPLEGGDAATGFKGQGATFPLAEVDLDGWFHVPGIFLVAVSRVRSPSHLHLRVFPNYMDIKLQRLKENVLDAQAFEEAVRVKSEWSYRHQESCQDQFWNIHTNLVADCIINVAVVNGLRINKDEGTLVENVEMLCKDTSTETIMHVIQKLMQSREYLVAEKAPRLSLEDYQTLQNYHKKKYVQTKTVTKDKQSAGEVTRTSSEKNKKNTRAVTKDKQSAGEVTRTSSEKNKKNTCAVPYQQQRNCPFHVPVPKENVLALKARPDIANSETFKGLQNSGNNVCFINSAIIALCHTGSFDSLLRQFHVMHRGCMGDLFGNDVPCPLCALYEVFNRAYRHHQLRREDVPKMPIIKLTESLIPGWRVGLEHDADEFLTLLLQRLDATSGCEIHKGLLKTTIICQRCKTSNITEDPHPTPFRINIHLAQFQGDEINIQAGINKWLTADKHVHTCVNCGQTPHDVHREIVTTPNLVIIHIHRDGRKRTLVDPQVIIKNQIHVFKSSINFHPRHYTTVGSTGQNHYVYYSGEDVQTCHGRLAGRGQYEAMNRVRAPLEEHATVLLYECQTTVIVHM